MAYSHQSFQTEFPHLLRVFWEQLVCLIIREICLFVTAANREIILLVTYASLVWSRSEEELERFFTKIQIRIFNPKKDISFLY